MVGFTNLLAGACLLSAVYGASSTSSAAYHQFTIPASADIGETLIANVDDPQAINAQSACPGYVASSVKHNARGLSAKLQLSGEPCNVYGTDVDSLDLTVEYLAKDRLNVQITPTYVDSSNLSWYQLSEAVVPRPQADKDATAETSDFELFWSNDPSFSFKVVRKATGDVLFDTTGSRLVFESQFIEFVTRLPKDYNLYGLGEHIQQLRLLENKVLTIYASDSADPIDEYVHSLPDLDTVLARESMLSFGF
jgi:alpha-glucosidase